MINSFFYNKHFKNLGVYLSIPILIIFSINLFNNIVFIICTFLSYKIYKKKVKIEKLDIYFFYFNIVVIFFLLFYNYFNNNSLNYKFLTLFKIFFTYFSFKYFLSDFLKKEKINLNKYICLTIIIIFFSIIFELLTKFNLGLWSYLPMNVSKLSGLYGDEKIAGTIILYLFGFYLISNDSKNNKFLFYLILFLVILGIFLTGQRSVFIKLVFFLTVYFFFKITQNRINKLLIILFFSILTLFTGFELKKIHNNYHNTADYIKNLKKNEPDCKVKPYKIGRIICRQFNTIQFQLQNFPNESYTFMYIAAYEIFKKNKIFGVGIKKFREECKFINLENYKFLSQKNEYKKCNTHPHHPILEILAETGILGLIYLLLSLLFIAKQHSDKLFHFSAITVIFLFPFLPSGSVFNNTNLTFLSILLCSFLLNKNEKNT